MASACAWSVALVGLEGRIVEVDADIGAGLPRTVLVGLPDSALYQARDRCKAAVSNSSPRVADLAFDDQSQSRDAAEGRQSLRSSDAITMTYLARADQYLLPNFPRS